MYPIFLAGYIFLRPDMTGFSSPWGYNRSGEGGAVAYLYRPCVFAEPGSGLSAPAGSGAAGGYSAAAVAAAVVCRRGRSVRGGCVFAGTWLAGTSCRQGGLRCSHGTGGVCAGAQPLEADRPVFPSLWGTGWYNPGCGILCRCAGSAAGTDLSGRDRLEAVVGRR